MQYKVNILIEKDENGYYAFSPQLKGCQTQGNTFEQTIDRMKEAVELYLEDLTEEERQQYVNKEVINTTLEVSIG